MGVDDAGRTLTLVLGLGGAGGRDWGESRRVVVVSVVLSVGVGGSSGATSGFAFRLGLAVVARLVGAVGEAVVGVEC